MEWEEKWWEASDWVGMKEMGAEKSGCRADGAAWRETWREAIGFDSASGEPMVERSAHKWAQDSQVSRLLAVSDPGHSRPLRLPAHRASPLYGWSWAVSKAQVLNPYCAHAHPSTADSHSTMSWIPHFAIMVMPCNTLTTFWGLQPSMEARSFSSFQTKERQPLSTRALCCGVMPRKLLQQRSNSTLHNSIWQ